MNVQAPVSRWFDAAWLNRAQALCKPLAINGHGDEHDAEILEDAAKLIAEIGRVVPAYMGDLFDDWAAECRAVAANVRGGE